MWSDENFYHYCLAFFFIISPLTFISLQFLSAPYGKHSRSGWGPTVPAHAAWFVMESPTLWLTQILFPFGKNRSDPIARILVYPYLIHYLHRTVIYPMRMKAGGRRPAPTAYPVSIAAMAFAFNLLNAYLQMRWVTHYADFSGVGPRFWWRVGGGVAVFVVGMVMNVKSDSVLLGLKSEGGGYKIPRGGWFELVSCPNYLGEILEWLGWAIMTWSWAGLGFFLYTCANLVPRAVSNHKWYLEKFKEDYPRGRKAVIPFLY